MDREILDKNGRRLGTESDDGEDKTVYGPDGSYRGKVEKGRTFTASGRCLGTGDQRSRLLGEEKGERREE